MILYIVTETLSKYRRKTDWLQYKHLLEKLSGDVCLIAHYSDLNRKLLDELRPWAICHSGSGTDFKDYNVLQCRNYRWTVTDYNAAQIGFCAGHQIIAVFFGSRLAPIRKLGANEPDLSAYHSGFFKEWGVYPVRVVRADPLFKGCGKRLRVPEYHYHEIKRLARDLVLLASTDNCRVQAFRHCRKPIYGTQFHPEEANKNYPDGFRILKNFFQIARAWRKSNRAKKAGDSHGFFARA